MNDKIVFVKVLLISPEDPERPTNLRLLVGGENTYTQNLLAYPPPHVKYIHYQQALKEGSISYLAEQKFLGFLMRIGLWPPDCGFQCLEIKDNFDLIHCHAYCLKVKNYAGPVVLSDSSSNFLFLKDYLGWSERKIDRRYRTRKLVSRQFDLYDPNLNITKAKRLIVWSGFAKKIHERLGGNGEKITVIPPGIGTLPVKKKGHQGFNILFIGTWFERKGGGLLLEVFAELKKKYPQVYLYLISQLPNGIHLPSGVYHENFLPREKLIKGIFPLADVLVLVPGKVEGYGLVVLEAASMGIPAIVSRVCALPEIVEDEVAGFVIPPSDPEALSSRLERLIKNKKLLDQMGLAAQKRFLEKFCIERTNKKLLSVYHEATNV